MRLSSLSVKMLPWPEANNEIIPATANIAYLLMPTLASP